MRGPSDPLPSPAFCLRPWQLTANARTRRIKSQQAQYETAIRSAAAAKVKNDVACECAPVSSTLRILAARAPAHRLPPLPPARARCSRAAMNLWMGRAKNFRDNRDRAQAMLLKVEQMQHVIQNGMDAVGQAQLMAAATGVLKANVAAMDADKMEEVVEEWGEGVDDLNNILELQAAPLATPSHLNAEEIDLDAEMAMLGPTAGAAAPAAAARAPAAAAPAYVPPAAYAMPDLPAVPSGPVAPRPQASSSMMEDLEALENA